MSALFRSASCQLAFFLHVTTAAPATLFLIDRFRIKDPLADHLHPPDLRVDLTEETAPISLVAGRPADLVHADQERVGIAVEVDAFDLLDVAALLPFSP